MLKKVIIVCLTIIIIIVGAIFYFNKTENSSDDNVLKIEEAKDSESSSSDDTNSNSSDDSEQGNDAEATVMYIDVAGAVKNPGVFTLNPGSRVFEAIEAAGGLSENANIQSINRAAVMNDGERIYVPTNKEVKNGDIPISTNDSGSSASNNSPTNDSGTNNQSGNSSSSGSGGKININTADSETLQQLNGVGPSTAQKIIDYRESNGKFKKPEDLKKVSGIGDKTFEKMKDHITV